MPASQSKKCDACLLVDPHQVVLQLRFFFFPFYFSSTFIFLGVVFDCPIFYSKPGSLLNAKFFSRLNAICCIFAYSLGPTKESHSLYKAFLWPIFTYASPGWFPFDSVSQVGTLSPSGQLSHHPMFFVLPNLFFPLWGVAATLRVILIHFTLTFV